MNEFEPTREQKLADALQSIQNFTPKDLTLASVIKALSDIRKIAQRALQ